MLKKAQIAYPSDFLIAVALTSTLRDFDSLDDKRESSVYARLATLLRPDSPLAWHSLGWSLLHRYFAETFGEKKQEHCELAEVAFRKALSVRPAFANGHVGLGIALKLQRKWPEAQMSFLKAIELDPNNAWYHRELGESYEKLDNLLEAEAAFKNSLRLDPANDRAISALSKFYAERKRYDDLERLYLDVAKLSLPAWVFGEFGEWLLAAERWPLAEDAFHKQASAKPGEGTLGLAIVQAKTGHYADAIEIYSRNETAIRLSKFSYTQLTDLAAAFKSAQQLREACEACSASLNREPNRHRLRLLLGFLQFAAGDAEAADTFLTTMRHDPALIPLAGYALGRLYIDAGKLDEAIAVWIQVVGDNPTDLDARVRLADAYRYRGRYTEAAAAYGEVLKLDPARKESNRTSAFARLLEMHRESGYWGEAVKAYGEWSDLVRAKGGDAAVNAGLYDVLRPLQPRLEGVIAGTDRPSDSAQAYQFASYCQILCSEIVSGGVLEDSIFEGFSCE